MGCCFLLVTGITFFIVSYLYNMSWFSRGIWIYNFLWIPIYGNSSAHAVLALGAQCSAIMARHFDKELSLCAWFAVKTQIYGDLENDTGMSPSKKCCYLTNFLSASALQPLFSSLQINSNNSTPLFITPSAFRCLSKCPFTLLKKINKVIFSQAWRLKDKLRKAFLRLGVKI